MVTHDATMSALMSASGPMVNAFSWMSIVPSTWPSMVMSSELVSVPWNFTDLPTHATTRRSSAGSGGLTGCTLGAAFGCSVAFSRVHIGLVPREWGVGTLVCLSETAPAASRVPAATTGQSVILQRSTY